MRRWPLALGLLALLAAAGCGTDGANKFKGSAPTADEVFGSCAFCHSGLANRMVAAGGHHDLTVVCTTCHDQDLKPNDPGPGHRNVPACADCHQEQMTHHDPAQRAEDQCLVCHTPHGSPNLFLVKESIDTALGTTSEIDFTNLRGQADGSFASKSDPGTGVCEVCHSTTEFYRSNGTGEDHFTLACFACHRHAAAFAPR